MNTILIIENDKSLADGLVRVLSSEQNAAESCGCIQSAREQGKQHRTHSKGKGGYGTMKLSRYEQETIVNYNAGEAPSRGNGQGR